MKIDEVINKQNIELFKRYNLTKTAEKIYKCVICGRSTCLNNSSSIEGTYLVCGWCAYDKEFDGWYEVRQWQNKMIGEVLENE